MYFEDAVFEQLKLLQLYPCVLILCGVNIMTIENTKSARNIRNVAATMAIENMHLSKDFVEELIKVSNGEKTSEQLRQEVIRKYAR